MSVEIVRALGRLVPVPGNVKVDRVDSRRAIPIQPKLPKIPWHPVVEKRGRMNEKWRSVHSQFGISVVLDDIYSTLRNLRRCLPPYQRAVTDHDQQNSERRDTQRGTAGQGIAQRSMTG